MRTRALRGRERRLLHPTVPEPDGATPAPLLERGYALREPPIQFGILAHDILGRLDEVGVRAIQKLLDAPAKDLLGGQPDAVGQILEPGVLLVSQGDTN